MPCRDGGRAFGHGTLRRRPRRGPWTKAGRSPTAARSDYDGALWPDDLQHPVTGSPSSPRPLGFASRSTRSSSCSLPASFYRPVQTAEEAGVGSPAQVTTHANEPQDLERIIGTWQFEALTGVPPSDLPPGALPDNQHDLFVGQDATFKWGQGAGRIEGSRSQFKLFVTKPTTIRNRFVDYGGSINVVVAGQHMRIWLPDLGQDRDVDRGEEVVDDNDSPDMAFRWTG